MGSKFFEVECGEDDVTIEVTEGRELIFHGWDRDTELAAIELGFKPTTCFFVWEAAQSNRLEHELFLRVEEGNATVVELLLAAGAEATGRDEYGWSPLHWVPIGGSVDVVELLLGAGADPNFENEQGRIALHIAAVEGNADMVKVLLEAGADPNVPDYHGHTPLNMAQADIHPDVVEILEACTKERP